MSLKENAQEFVTLLSTGQMQQAFDKFYHNDCVVIEKPTGEVRNGKEAQAKALQQWSEMQQEFHGMGIDAVTVNEDSSHVMIESWVDVTFKDGNRMKMEEVAVQKWSDGQIIEEKFYYSMPGGGNPA